MGYNDDTKAEYSQSSSPINTVSAVQHVNDLKNGIQNVKSIANAGKQASETAKKGAGAAKTAAKAGEQVASAGAKAAETAGKAAAGTAAGAATAGIGTAVLAAKDAAKKAKDAGYFNKLLKESQRKKDRVSYTTSNNPDKDKSLILKLVLLILGLFMVFNFTLGTLLTALNPLTNTSMYTSQYDIRQAAIYSWAKDHPDSAWASFIIEHAKLLEVAGSVIATVNPVLGVPINVIGFFANDTEKSSIGEYDHEDVYSDSIEENLNMCKKSAKKAYDTALKEARQYCKNNGYDWSKSKATLKSTNSNSWEDVYSEVNYADMIAGLSLVYNGNEVTDEFDPDDFSKFIKQKEVLQHLYYITYDSIGEETEYNDSAYYAAMEKYSSQGGGENPPNKENYKVTVKYVTINIHPFTVYTLMTIDNSSNAESDKTVESKDFFDENSYSYNVSFYDMMLAQSLQLVAEANDELREQLQYQNQTPLMEYATITSISDEFTDDASEVLYPEGGDWYSGIAIDEIDPSAAGMYDGWMAYYSTPTVSGSGYFIDTNSIAASYINQLNAAGVNAHMPSGWASYEFGNGYWMYKKSSYQGIVWDIGYKHSAMKNGRYLIAVGPGIVTPGYWETTGGVGNPASNYNYGNLKMDLVLTKLDDGVDYYVPVTPGDSKGHTFPTGILQSGMRIPGSATEPINGASFSSASDSASVIARDNAFANVGTAQNWIDATSNYDNLLRTWYAGNGYSINTWFRHGVVEWCYKSSEMDISGLNSTFKLKGVIVYK